MAERENDIDLKDWIGREETGTDQLTLVPVAALNATLDRDDPMPQVGDILPPLYHWLYFLPLARTAELDTDGHPKRGGFLPPVTQPRRMWVGSDVTFAGDLRLGETAERVSTIENIDEKQGRSGKLVFVTIHHQITGAGGAVADRQTVVYRDRPTGIEAPAPGKPAPSDAAYQRTVVPSAALLFRYSALIFNAHRIHYDTPYTREEEGYPGLLVHGPLLATLMTDLVRRNLPGRAIRHFHFRAVKPVFDDAPFEVCGKPGDAGGVALWVRDAAGELCVDGGVEMD